MSTEIPNLPDDDLVAYLDGELEAERIAEIEKMLREQPGVRERLAELQNTWDLLDTIPRAQATHSFTRSTLELVVDDAKKQLRKSREGLPVWPMYLIAAALTLAIGGTIGFLMIDHYQKQPLRELVADLETIENVDKYLVLEDVSFLKLLEEEDDLFVYDDELDAFVAEGNSDSAANPDAIEISNQNHSKSNGGYTFKEGLAYIRSLDNQALLDLKRKQSRFSELSVDEQKHVRKIHAEIERQPNPEELRAILSRYHEWLKSLKSSKRADLLETKPLKRIETIRFWQTQQQQQTFGIEDSYQIPNVDDTSIVYSWLGETLSIGMEDEKGKKAARSRNYRSRAQLLENVLVDQNIARELFFTDERINDLYDKLTPESQLIIDEMPTAEAQIELVIQWSRAVASWRVTSFQREAAYAKLSSDQRSKVDEMSIESRRRYLDRSYLRMKRRR